MRHIENILNEILQMQNMVSKNALSGFSIIATGQFIDIFIARIFNLGRLSVRYGPCDLNEIPWQKEILASIIIGLFCGWIVYMLDKAEKAKGKNFTIPRIKFRNFGVAVLFFTVLFFGFIFIFVVREYNEKMSEISYIFRKTFWHFCSTQVPWPEIIATSLIFGIILAIGFSTVEKRKEKETIDDQ